MKWIPAWEGSFPAIRVFGNLYFVGTKAASTHIIDTGDGLIMLDSGYQHSLYSVIDGIYYYFKDTEQNGVQFAFLTPDMHLFACLCHPWNNFCIPSKSYSFFTRKPHNDH